MKKHPKIQVRRMFVIWPRRNKAGKLIFFKYANVWAKYFEDEGRGPNSIGPSWNIIRLAE